ncbi:MAG: hypothetical protein RL385_2368 [Pseudomonadota bacterium]
MPPRSAAPPTDEFKANTHLNRPIQRVLIQAPYVIPARAAQESAILASRRALPLRHTRASAIDAECATGPACVSGAPSRAAQLRLARPKLRRKPLALMRLAPPYGRARHRACSRDLGPTPRASLIPTIIRSATRISARGFRCGASSCGDSELFRAGGRPRGRARTRERHRLRSSGAFRSTSTSRARWAPR